MSHSFRHPILAFLYLTYIFISFIFIKFPFWFISYILFPSTRPVPSWPLKRCLYIQFFRAMLLTGYHTGIYAVPAVDPKIIPENPEEKGYVIVDPIPENLIRGSIAETAKMNHVQAVPAAGYWYGERDKFGRVGRVAAPAEKIAYHFHGGGYIVSKSKISYITVTFQHPQSSQNSAVKSHISTCQFLLSSSPISRVFALEYRSSVGVPLKAQNPFPAALLDALAGYYYLVHTLHFDPANILLAGDSAGAHLALCLLRYLVHERPDHDHDISGPTPLPAPQSLLLLSAWLDLSSTPSPPQGSPLSSSSLIKHKKHDIIHEFLYGAYPQQALLGSLHPSALELSPYFSPASPFLPSSTKQNLFRGGFPKKVCFVAGEKEMFRDEILRTVDKMREDLNREADSIDDKEEDAEVIYIEGKDCCHDFTWFAWCEPERSKYWVEIGEWIGTIWR